MPTTDIIYVLQWWLVLFIIGLSVLPITLRLFSPFFDKGYIFSKIIGTAFLCYIVFLCCVIRIAPFTVQSIFVALISTTLVSCIGFAKKETLTQIQSGWKIFIFEELIFLLGIFTWAFVRGNQPDIHGLEKYMDFGFINSILRSTYLPPADMWYTPFPINYYYFGHFATAVLTKLSGISSNITFNLMLATIFSFTFMCSFSIGTTFFFQLFTHSEENVKKIAHKITILIAGIFTAFLITFGGNIHSIYTFFKPYDVDNPVPFWQLPFLFSTFPNSYWYPNATRFIYHTIHEFPIYSFVVSDLHGHVLDIPFVLLTIAVVFTLFVKANIAKQWSLFGSIFLGFLLAIMYMTNAWDGIIYFLLSFMVILYIEMQRRKYNMHARNFFMQFLSSHFLEENAFLDICISIFMQVLTLGISFYLFSRPFAFFFDTADLVHGIGVLCAPTFLTNMGHLGPFLFEADHCQHSPFWQLFILYGFFYFFVFGFLWFLSGKKKGEKIIPTDIFVLILIILSTLLIIIPEFVYLKDIYPAHYRANTMFKLVYQSFMMLSLCCGYIIVRLFLLWRNKIRKVFNFYFLYFLFSLVFLALVFIYPYFAITSYYGQLQNYTSLDGTKYLQKLYPTDYDAILWLNTNIAGQPVILEAQGDSYTDYARVSANTGLPTVLGWTVHEWLWRGSYSPLPERINDVQTMYESPDITITKQLLDKYNVSFVFIGQLEREKYKNLQEDKFAELGKLIYRNGTTSIYQIEK